MKRVIGQVSEDEKKEIRFLFERRSGLSELAKIVTAENEPLYEKLVKDMGETNIKFESWWDCMAQQYHWEAADGGHWEIDFNTNEVYLVEEAG